MTVHSTYNATGSIDVLIYEMEHYEVIATLIKLFSYNNNQITCVISHTVYEKLDEIFSHDRHLYTPIILPENTNCLKTFLLFQKTIKKTKPGLIFLSTVSHNHLLFAFLLKNNSRVRNILTVHDINCLFAAKRQPGFKNFIRFIGKKRLVNAVNEFNVIADTMVKSLHQYIGNQKPIHTISGAVYNADNKFNPLRQSIKLAVPGSIDAKRRNYQEVFELLCHAEEHNLALEIYFAGGYADKYGNAIVEKVKTLHLKKCRIHTFKPEGLSQTEFDYCLAQSHFIYMPCVIQTSICQGIEEIYGETKSSGNISDAIQFAKPFIAPYALKIPDGLKSSCFMYKNSGQIISFLSLMLKQPSLYQQLYNTAIENASEFTTEKIRATHPSIFHNTFL